MERGPGPHVASPRLFPPAQVRARCRRASVARRAGSAGPGLGTRAPLVGRPLRAPAALAEGAQPQPMGKSQSHCRRCYFNWDFQGEVAGSANSPTDKAYLKAGVLMPMLCFYCHGTLQLDVLGARDGQPCPHTAPKGQGPRPLPDPWESDYTSGPKYGIFIVISDEPKILSMCLWSSAHVPLAHSNHISAPGLVASSPSGKQRPRVSLHGASDLGKHSGCSQTHTEPSLPTRELSKGQAAGLLHKHGEGSSGNFQPL